MKILFISDIHGIKKNLEYVRKLEEKENFDKIVVLGDLYYPGPNYDNKEEINSSYVKDFLMNYQAKIICLKGNCDSDVDIKATDFPICNNLALINTDGLDIYCTHGNEYNIEKDGKFNKRGILVYGHDHYPFIKRKGEMLYINTGSISLPKKESKPSYLIYENRKFTIYDIEGNVVDEIIA
jgi:hypothetical protein